MSLFRKLARPALLSLADALESGRFPAEVAEMSKAELRRHIPRKLDEEIGEELRAMLADGMAPRHIARLLRAVAAERTALQAVTDRVELVWSGVEEPGSMTRDTSVVVAELFLEAHRSLLVSSYVVDAGEKAEALFGPLAARMDEDPELSVRLFLNVRREYRDETPEAILLREFADRFRGEVWPGERLPMVYHDPRSLAVGGAARSCLHAKCVVVDEDRAFVSSANFTEAAHQRNIEAGLLVTDRQLAMALRGQFETFVERDMLQRVPGL